MSQERYTVKEKYFKQYDSQKGVMKAIELSNNHKHIDVRENFIDCVAILRAIFKHEVVTMKTVQFLNYISNNLPETCIFDESVVGPIFANIPTKDLDLTFRLIYPLDKLLEFFSKDIVYFGESHDNFTNFLIRLGFYDLAYKYADPIRLPISREDDIKKSFFRYLRNAGKIFIVHKEWTKASKAIGLASSIISNNKAKMRASPQFLATRSLLLLIGTSEGDVKAGKGGRGVAGIDDLNADLGDDKDIFGRKKKLNKEEERYLVMSNFLNSEFKSSNWAEDFDKKLKFIEENMDIVQNLGFDRSDIQRLIVNLFKSSTMRKKDTHLNIKQNQIITGGKNQEAALQVQNLILKIAGHFGMKIDDRHESLTYKQPSYDFSELLNNFKNAYSNMVNLDKFYKSNLMGKMTNKMAEE